MSDLLTHWAVFDDCRRLAKHDPNIAPLFVHLLNEEQDAARLGAITRGGHRWGPAILAETRDQWPGSDDDEVKLGRRVAFALGGITHFAADAILKPLMSERAEADWNTTHHVMQGGASGSEAQQDAETIRELSSYYDTHVFREVYLSGNEEPFTRLFLDGNDTVPGQTLEAFARSLFQRALLSCHTLNPDPDDQVGWVDTLLGRIQPFYLDVDRWIQSFVNPDPEEVRRFGVETDFYRASDPAVELARSLQRGGQAVEGAVDGALRAGVNEGGYGRALELGMERLRSASAYWRRETDALPNLQQIS